jgi:hypothetical protein
MGATIEPMTSAIRLPATAPSLRGRLAASAAALLFAFAWLSVGASTVLGADVTMTAEAMLGGHVRPGAWTAIRVSLGNDGPPVTGELRLAGKAAGRSTYGIAVDLPTTARKEYTLYAHSPIFGGKIDVTLVSGEQTLATSSVTITGHDQYQPIVVVIAERPQSIVPDIQAAAVNPNGPSNAAIVTLAPAALPRRVEAWTAIDRLVWQDVDSALLDADQLSALASWVAAGGTLVIAGGTTGVTTLSGFPVDLLPFQPRGTVDVEPVELASMLGTLPAGAARLPALEGTLLRGTVLARSPNGVIAAEAAIGSGSVTVIGFDPATSWLKGSTAARGVWRRVLPSSFGQAVNPLLLPDDSQIVNALNQLPSVDLPPIDQLFILLLAYIALVGPLNYLVLRRLDKREWAWITMPVLVAVFAVAAYTLGVGLKGSDVIINQVGIVRGAQGTERGLGQVYIGVFSPTRAKYDVKVPGGALLSNPISQLVPGAVEQPLDVVLGDPSRLRDYQVGFGQLRGFRAETAMAAPKVDSELHLDGGRLKGTITNRSATELQAAAVVFGGSVAILGTMPPGSQQTLDIAATGLNDFQMSLSDRLYGQQFTTDPTAARRLLTRRAVIDQLTIYSQKFGGGSGLGEGPVLVAWDPHPALDVDIGDSRVTRVGETMYLTPLSVTVGGRGIFAQGLIHSTMLASDAAQANDQGNGAFDFGHGTMTVEYRPIAFDGRFMADKLKLRFTQGEPFDSTADGKPVDPLPADRQPAQDDPVGKQVQPTQDGIPEFQLFDRTSGTWQEFAHVGPGSSVMIGHPERYVDASGSLLVRFVNRAEQEYFQIVMRLEGTIS